MIFKNINIAAFFLILANASVSASRPSEFKVSFQRQRDHFLPLMGILFEKD
jgi:hypothetical protein